MPCKLYLSRFDFLIKINEKCFPIFKLFTTNSNVKSYSIFGKGTFSLLPSSQCEKFFIRFPNWSGTWKICMAEKNKTQCLKSKLDCLNLYFMSFFNSLNIYERAWKKNENYVRNLQHFSWTHSRCLRTEWNYFFHVHKINGKNPTINKEVSSM